MEKQKQNISKPRKKRNYPTSKEKKVYPEVPSDMLKRRIGLFFDESDGYLSYRHMCGEEKKDGDKEDRRLVGKRLFPYTSQTGQLVIKVNSAKLYHKKYVDPTEITVNLVCVECGLVLGELSNSEAL